MQTIQHIKKLSDYSSTEERMLVRKVMAEDHDAAVELEAVLVPFISWVCTKYGLDGDGHEDTVQEAVALVFVKLHMLDQDRRLLPWVRTLTKNCALAYRSRMDTSGAIVISLDDAGDNDSASAMDIHDDRVVDPRRQVFNGECAAIIASAINGLDEKIKAVVMRKYDGMKHHEIADELGIPIGTVQSRLARGYAILRDDLACIAP